MKTILLFLAMASAALCQPITIPAKDSPLYITSGIYDMKAITVSKYQFLVVSSKEGEVLTIKSLPTLPPPADKTQFYNPAYVRPEKPEEVEITLCTKDGNKWKAKWEEVK